MPVAGTSNTDEPIRVVVTPSQASYFAGETFSVTITIINVRTQEAAVPLARSASHSASQFHKRGAHSISSVPLARPPTSPVSRGTLTQLPPGSKQVGAQPTGERRGLIGSRTFKGVKTVAEGATNGKRPPLTKSLSLSINPSELESHVMEDLKGKSPVHAVRNQDAYNSPTSPRISSPLARSASVPVNHPHARKQSVLDGQLQLQDLRPPPTLSPFSQTPNASTSAFSLSLDPITESASSPGIPPITPSNSFPSPIPETTAADFRTPMPDIPSTNATTITTKGKDVSHAYPPRAPHLRQGHRPTNLGLGYPANNNTATNAPRTAFSSSFPVPDTELILYSYAHLVGTLSIIPPPGASPTPEQARMVQHIRSSLLKRQGIGGGSMDIASLSGQSTKYGNLSPGVPRRSTHSRSSSLSAGLFSLISPSTSSPGVSSQPRTPGHRGRTPSVVSGFLTPTSPAPPISASNSQAEEEFVDPDVPLPTLEVQPTMIAVDLSLGPGESRNYSYTLPLPENLPPTFRGRTLRFSYQFILGICRAGSGTSSSSQSRVMKVPIRVYTHVKVGRPPTPYDLLWPVGLRKRMNLQSMAKVVEISAASKVPVLKGPAATPDTSASTGAYLDLQAYAHNLLAGLPDPANGSNRATTPRPPIPSGALSDHRLAAAARGLDFAAAPSADGDDGAPPGCREAVELLTRNPKKLSYDVNKDGVKVAVLTFTKVAYRLGETVLGVVELNEPSSRARVLRLSALLEAHETLPGSISSTQSSRHMRRVHAEQHSSFVTSTLRTTFSLDIPPDASPAFQVDVESDKLTGSPSHAGGLEWKVRLCLLVSVGSPHTRTDPSGVRLKNLVRDGPSGEWGSSWKAAATIAPMEWPDARAMLDGHGNAAVPASGSWVSFLASTLFGSSERPYHDGDEGLEEDEDGAGGVRELEVWGSEGDWRSVRVEMVECEVPIAVWPGNTAYKAGEVVFGV